MKFSIDQSEYKDHPHNTTLRNERAIELVLAERFLTQFGDSILEVGAVTPYYFPNAVHPVADPFDEHARVTIKKCAEDLDFTNLNVLSISTLEHIGQTKGDTNDAFRVIRRITEQSRNCLITLPPGLHPQLSDSFKAARTDFNYLFYVKTNTWRGPIWEIHSEGFDYPYPSLTFGWAESIVVIYKLGDLTSR